MASSSTGNSQPATERSSGVDPVEIGKKRASPGITAALSAAPVQKSLPIGLLLPDAMRVKVGTMSDVGEIPAVKSMLEKAELILGFDVLKLCREGPEDWLWAARGSVAYIAGLAGLEKLREERGEAVTCAQVLAGFDVGEYAALKAAGVFSFEDGLRLVKVRCEAVVEAARARQHAQLWVFGLDTPKLAELCATAAEKEGRGAVCQIADENSQRDLVVGGTEESIQELNDLALAEGALLTKVERSPAVHTPLMKPAQEKLIALLDELLPNMSQPRTTVYMTTTGTPMRPGTNPKDIVEVLKRELTSCVLWGPSVKAMINEGVSEFYEMGPGQLLKDRMKRINNKAWRTMTNVKV